MELNLRGDNLLNFGQESHIMQIIEENDESASNSNEFQSLDQNHLKKIFS